MTPDQIRTALPALGNDSPHVACIECANWTGAACAAGFHPSETRIRALICGRYWPLRPKVEAP